MAARQIWPAYAGDEEFSFFDDVSGFRERFEWSARNVFAGEDEINVETCVVNSFECRADRLHSLKELEIFLAETTDIRSARGDVSTATARLFFLQQKHSRSELLISKEAIVSILSSLQVFPQFVNILTSFGVQCREPCVSKLGLGSFYVRNHELENGLFSFETAYVLKYAERNGRSNNLPWSIRRMGVYQSYDQAALRSECILVRSSERVEKRMLDLAKEGTMALLPTHWTLLHELHLGTLTQNWQELIEYKEDEFSKTDFYYFTKVGPNGQVWPTFNDIQAINQHIDEFSRLLAALDLNIDIFALLSQEATQRARFESKKFADRYAKFHEALRASLTEHTFLKQQILLIRSFAERRVVQLRDVIALQDSRVMKTLNHKTIQETQTMRTITLVALVYLPATFTATFLSMGFVHVESLSGIMRVNVSKDMWFYLAITAPLMFVTLLAWWLWELKVRRKNRMEGLEDDDDEKLKDV